ncbi:hypothetical protein KC685_05160 [Candidatus Dojkabacteria bacterium]|uniref:Uncharacterized protein n=1 Tax=Candidatus Dojkabacteria bacterium TaxID=2099670 RepID=A0A955I2G6_9BACT|nr:hypothetical protein [Candidatus Dojkabacteria bacterium]
MQNSEKVPIKLLDTDPDPNVLYFEDRLSDSNPPDQSDPGNSQSLTINIEHKQPKTGFIKKAKRVGAAALVVAGGYGAYNFVQGLMSDEEAQFSAEVEVDETRVYVYENTPIQLAEIESDISLDIEAGYDRTGPFGIDINPINNMYKLDQDGLTTSTNAEILVEQMRVEETDDMVNVYLGGELGLSNASINWAEEDMEGADITWNSYSIGNDTKDKIDNDALEITQGSSGVAAACGLRDETVQESLTGGVANFLSIVNPNLVESGKPIKVFIDNLDEQADSIYAEEVDKLNEIVDGIRLRYDGENDVFVVDISQILDCSDQDIRLAEDE